MRTFLLSMAGAFTAMFAFFFFIFILFLMVIPAIFSAAMSSSAEHPEAVVLTLDLNEEYADQSPVGGLAALSGTPGFIDLLTKLKGAETDDSVKGLYLRGNDFGFGSARAEELRAAIHNFQDSGKFVIAHSQGMFGVGGPSTLRSISAADEIWIQPGADIVVAGVSLETEFLKGLFDMIDVTPEIYPFYEYKNAANSYNETSLTEPHREALTRLANVLWTASLEDIAADRNLDVDTMRATLESGPLTHEQVLASGLMDKTGYPEEAEQAALDQAGEHAELVELAGYTPPAVSRRAPLIAVVGGEGPVVTGSSESDSLFSSSAGFASDTVARAILDAGKNEEVKAILFRVDSPGGSPIASDQIWNAIERVQADGKPVIVSMGSVAASGGYYVSAGADYIMANESTLTGSIGIFGGKFALEGGFNKIGITFEEVTVGGEFADAYGTDAFTETQTETVKASLKRGYDRFLGIVGEGRGMTYDEVHEIARGRVWSGSDAQEHGLVDGIGTFMDAIEKAKELAGIEADVTPRLIQYPQRKTGFEAFEALFGVSEDTAETMATINALTKNDRVQMLIDELAMIEAANSGQTQAMAPRVRER